MAAKDAYSSYSIIQDGKDYIIQNNKMGGDAMFSKNTGFSDDEPWFATDAGENKYRWKLIPVK